MIPTSVPWFETEDDFKAVLGMFPVEDRRYAMSYAEWILSIQKHEGDLSKRGLRPVRVTVKPVSIKGWCEVRNLTMGRKAVFDYATDRLSSRTVEKG